ncbi:unnamed protein product, partial [Anisakis simplex]|uniref:SEA domain-containing protein n=1 Tax=Anisakis simplex TaxID=6269 RepID=A0A0M3J5Q4_ANISI
MSTRVQESILSEPFASTTIEYLTSSVIDQPEEPVALTSMVTSPNTAVTVSTTFSLEQSSFLKTTGSTEFNNGKYTNTPWRTTEVTVSESAHSTLEGSDGSLLESTPHSPFQPFFPTKESPTTGSTEFSNGKYTTSPGQASEVTVSKSAHSTLEGSDGSLLESTPHSPFQPFFPTKESPTTGSTEFSNGKYTTSPGQASEVTVSKSTRSTVEGSDGFLLESTLPSSSQPLFPDKELPITDNTEFSNGKCTTSPGQASEVTVSKSAHATLEGSDGSLLESTPHSPFQPFFPIEESPTTGSTEFSNGKYTTSPGQASEVTVSKSANATLQGSDGSLLESTPQSPFQPFFPTKESPTAGSTEFSNGKYTTSPGQASEVTVSKSTRSTVEGSDGFLLEPTPHSPFQPFFPTKESPTTGSTEFSNGKYTTSPGQASEVTVSKSANATLQGSDGSLLESTPQSPFQPFFPTKESPTAGSTEFSKGKYMSTPWQASEVTVSKSTRSTVEGSDGFLLESTLPSSSQPLFPAKELPITDNTEFSNGNCTTSPGQASEVTVSKSAHATLEGSDGSLLE